MAFLLDADRTKLHDDVQRVWIPRNPAQNGTNGVAGRDEIEGVD